jgi:hypothetical protein
MPPLLRILFILILIALAPGCGGGHLRDEVPKYIKLGSMLESKSSYVSCVTTVFELKNKDLNALRQTIVKSKMWKDAATLDKLLDGMSAGLKLISCGKLLERYAQDFDDIINNLSQHQNELYYYLSGDRLFIAVSLNKKLVFVFGGSN